MEVAQRFTNQVPAISPADRQVSGAVTVRGAVTLLALRRAPFLLRHLVGNSQAVTVAAASAAFASGCAVGTHVAFAWARAFLVRHLLPPARLRSALEPTMNPSSSLAFIKRNDLLKLLSDNEVASVSLAETAVQLSDGDEYLDLSNLDKGVRSARKETIPMGRVLPRKALTPETWSNILAQLAPMRTALAATRL